MKRCEYCGKENEDLSASCFECGTPFPSTASGAVREPDQESTLLITSGLGALLIVTALFFVVGRILGQLGVFGNLPAAQQGAMYSFFTSTKPAPFIVLAAIPLVFTLYRRRLSESRRGNAAAVVTCFLLIALALLPWITPAAVDLWCFPAVVLWQQGGSSAGCYIGAALQLAAGACLLLMFYPRKCEALPTLA